MLVSFPMDEALRKDRTSLIVHRGEHSTKVFSTSGKIPGRIPGTIPRRREWHEGFFGSGEDSRENSGEKGVLWRYLSRILSGREYSWNNSRENASISKCHRSEEHTSELQSQSNLVCRLLLEKKKTNIMNHIKVILESIPSIANSNVSSRTSFDIGRQLGHV